MARPKVLRECPKCHVSLGAREMQVHVCAPQTEPTREECIAQIERLVASGEAGYRIGRAWGKQRLGLTLRQRLERRSTAQLRSILAGRAGVKSWNLGRCKICNHQEREAIDQALKDGASYREIGRKYGMNKQSVARHVDHVQVVAGEMEAELG
jgi:DNA-binding NarL/FixJ family response regulator